MMNDIGLNKDEKPDKGETKGFTYYLFRFIEIIAYYWIMYLVVVGIVFIIVALIVCITSVFLYKDAIPTATR